MTKSQSMRAVRASPAKHVIVTLWILLLALSVYHAQSIRDEIDGNDALREQTWLRDGMTLVMRVGDAVGMSLLRRMLGGVRDGINARYTVLEASDGVEPAAPSDNGQPRSVAGRAQSGKGNGRRPKPMRHVTAHQPRRILVIGASSIQFAVGVELEKRLPRAYEGIKVKRFGQLATGLTRPDFMNWPEKLRSLAKSFRPDLVICNFGGNDAQAIPVGKYNRIPYGTPEWDTKYGERIAEMIDIASEYGAETVMIGMANMRNRKFAKKMLRLNRVMKQVTEDRGMLFVSSYEKASTPSGSYRTTIEYKGRRGLMRTSDGVHYTKLGAQFIIEHVMREVERRYHLVPTSKRLGFAERHGFESPTLGETVWYTAYVPRDLKARRPGVVVLPDGQDDWSKWPRFPHRELQKWAQRRQVILVVPEAAENTAYVGKLASVLGEELPLDLRRSLPVDSVAYAGSGRGALSALAAGQRSPGLLLYRPWFDARHHDQDPALIAALGDPKTNAQIWDRVGRMRKRGPPVWLQAGPKADALRKGLGGRLLDAGPPAKTFLRALDAGLPVLVPAPEERIVAPVVISP